DTIPVLLPPMARGARADAHKTTRVAAVTASGLDAIAGGAITDKQRDALELLAGTPTGIQTAVLAARGISADTVSRLARHGYVSLRHDRLDRDPFEGRGTEGVLGSAPSDPDSATSPRRLTGEQTAAFERLRAIADRKEFRVALLH